jgi:hypothetical protein
MSGKINFMNLFSFLGGLGELLCSWRFYLGVLLSVPFAIWLHERFGNEPWVELVSIPIVAVGLVGGWIWQWKHDKKQINKH